MMRNLRLTFILTLLISCKFHAQTSCGSCKDVIFIVDNSGSIDDWEFSTMQTSIDQLSNQILAANPTTRIAVVQYGGIDITLSPGLYDISIPFSSNPATVASWNRVYGPVSNIWNDYLPASMASMRLDGIWNAGGSLDLVSSPCNPVFILFTDAYGNAETWGSTLFNAGGLPGFAGYGEYNHMKTTYNANFIVYHVTADDPTGAPPVGAAIASVGGSYNGVIDPNPGDPEGSQTVPRNYYTGSFQFNQITVDDILYSMANTQSSFTYTDDCSGNVDFESTSTSSQTIISWEWDFGDGSATSSVENPSHTYSPGQYDVTLVVEGDLGCRDTIVQTLDIVQIVPVTGTDTTICSGENVTLGSPSVSGQTYSWTPATGLSSANAAQPVATPINTITYTLVITGSNGCETAGETVQITVAPSPVATMNSSQEICVGEDVQIGPTSVSSLSYSWSPITNLSSNTIAQPLASPPTTTTYTVTATSANGCTGTASTTVTVHPLPTVSAGPDQQICLGDTVILSGSGAQTYSWNNGVSNGDEFVPNVGNLSYTVTGTDAFGCTNTDLLNINTYNLPVADFTVDNQVMSSIDPSVEFTNNSSNAVSYFWDFGDNTGTSTEVSPSYEYGEDQFGGMPVMLIATSPDGCVDTAFMFLIVNEETIFYVPNAFTPNGDEFNNDFKPVITSGYDIYNFSFLIFDRWGEQIFESKDPSQGWDGTCNGSIVQNGTYVWKVSLKVKNNDDRKIYEGHLTVLR
jgi:gliding motility-associated-like protein